MNISAPYQQSQLKPVYEIIESLCVQKNITINMLCKETGIRQTVLSDIKHGRSKSLSMRNIWKIAKYFGVSTDVFFVERDSA